MKGIKAAAAAAQRRTDTPDARGTPSPSTSAPRAKVAARNLEDLDDQTDDDVPRIIGLDDYQQAIYNRRIKDPRILNQKLFLDTYGIQAIEK